MEQLTPKEMAREFLRLVKIEYNEKKKELQAAKQPQTKDLRDLGQGL